MKFGLQCKQIFDNDSEPHTVSIRRDGLLHCAIGPALDYKNGGYREWRINGQLHREDGPAREWDEGNRWCLKKHCEWYLNDKSLTKTQFDLEIQKRKEIKERNSRK